MIISFEHMKMMKLAILALCSYDNICIIWGKFKPFNLSTLMLGNVCCKLLVRLHKMPFVFKSNVYTKWAAIVRLLLREILECTTFMPRGCAKLSYPTLSSLMYVCQSMALNKKNHFLVDHAFPSLKC
jgi:hypothetical protein